MSKKIRELTQEEKEKAIERRNCKKLKIDYVIVKEKNSY